MGQLVHPISIEFKKKLEYVRLRILNQSPTQRIEIKLIQ